MKASDKCILCKDTVTLYFEFMPDTSLETPVADGK